MAHRLLQAAPARAQAALDGGLGVAAQARAVDGEHEQHIALVHAAPFDNMAFGDDAGLRRHEPQHAAVGNEIASDVGLARVAPFEQKDADDARDQHHERRQHRQRNGPDQLNAAQPRLLTAFDHFTAEQTGHEVELAAA